MFDTLLSLGGTAYSIASRVHQGRRMDEMIASLRAIDTRVERLSSSILHVPTLTEVRAVGDVGAKAVGGAELREILEPLQRALGSAILSTGGIEVIRPTGGPLGTDLRSLLVDPVPVSRARGLEGDTMVPIVW